MPPIRNYPMPIKPVKTERTHEENQERAYIAASRRSDRSLEARIESARRASEIHKRRTGRSLRVREEDVINEEMYEEEDDDLPQQYRRLTAHLATSNTEFDRRLRAYITNQVAMRSVFGQAAVGAWQNDQPFPSTAHFLPPGLMQTASPIAFSTNTMPSPNAFSQPSPNYRQSPYPVQGSAIPKLHQRSHSAIAPLTTSLQVGQQSHSAQASPVEHKSLLERRTSMPVHALSGSPFGQQHFAPNASSPAISTGTASPHTASTPLPLHAVASNQNTNPTISNSGGGGGSLDPISIALPLESQQLLAGGPLFNFQDPFINMGFGDDLKSQQPTYSYNPNSKARSASFTSHDTFTQGLDQTLWSGSAFLSGDDSFFDTSSLSVQPSELENSLDMNKVSGRGGISANSPAPIKEEWESFLQGDAFDEQSGA